MLSLALPPRFSVSAVDELYRGILSLAVKTGVSLVGGDTNAAGRLIISPCVIGHAPYRPVRRSGARPGDDIYVTGTLGDSALALEFLRRGRRPPGRSHFSYLLSRHHRPSPRLAAGVLLARRGLATAMIDISDGLLQDLEHVCAASRVGAMVWEGQLPLSDAYRAAGAGSRCALSGGEDYELLFCARPGDRGRVESLQKRVQLPMTRIGQCVSAGKGIVVIGEFGAARRLPDGGHDHFSPRRRKARSVVTAAETGRIGKARPVTAGRNNVLQRPATRIV
jgi:thiamine-monophosphate kinase